MFGNGFGWPHLLIILVVVIILFGAKRLPDAARGVGKSLRIFKSEAKAMREEGQNDENAGDESQSTAQNAGNTQPGQLSQSNSGTNGSTPSPQPAEKQKNDVQS